MEKKTLYLHIGRHKTGTSSLQQFLSQNSKLLAKHGVLYPLTGRQVFDHGPHIAHHDLSRTLKHGDEAALKSLKSDLSAELADYTAFVLSSEDFQNLDDFKKLRYVFEDYHIHVVCYLREYLSYLLSSFAQRIHNTSDVFNIAAYIKREDIPLRQFMQSWTQFADQVDFRLYERSQLKDQDIVADFLDVFDLSKLAKTSTVYESNPSLSGNLLGLKMFMNLTGQSDLIPYQVWAEATKLDPSFKGKLHIDDESAFKMRSAVPYNSVLRAEFPKVSEASFEGGSKLFDLERWDDDMALIASLPNFKLANFFRMSNFGGFLSQANLSVDPFQFEGLDENAIGRTELLDEIKENRLKLAAKSSREAALAAKSAYVRAEEGFRRSQKDLDRVRETNKKNQSRLKKQTEKAEKANSALKKTKAELADIVAKLKTQSERAIKFRADLDAEKASKSEAVAKIRETLESERANKLTLQEKLKTQNQQAETINSKLKSAKTDLADLAAKLKTQSENAVKFRADLEAEKANKGETSAKLRESLESERASKLELQEKLKTQTKQAGDINSKLKVAKADLADLAAKLKTQSENAVKFRADLEAEKANKGEASAKLRESLESERASKLELQEKLKTQTKQAGDINSKLKVAKADLADLAAKLKTQSENAAKFRAELDAERKSKLDLQKKLKTQTEQAGKINNTLQSTKADLALLASRLKTQSEQTAHLQKSLDAGKALNDGKVEI